MSEINGNLDMPNNVLGWTNVLANEVVSLGKQLLYSSPMAEADSYVPMHLILSELEKLYAMICVANELHPNLPDLGVGPEFNLKSDWTLKCLEGMDLSPEKIMDAYEFVLDKFDVTSVAGNPWKSLRELEILNLAFDPQGRKPDLINAQRRYLEQLLKISFVVLKKWFLTAGRTNKEAERAALKDYLKTDASGLSPFDLFLRKVEAKKIYPDVDGVQLLSNAMLGQVERNIQEAKKLRTEFQKTNNWIL